MLRRLYIDIIYLSVELAISGKSVSRSVKRICLGNNGKNKDAPSILNILPQLALVAIKYISWYW